MLRDYFDAALAFIYRPDIDGQGYHATPHDDGGCTIYGCTYATWFAWQRMHNAPATIDAFKILTQEELQPLYRAQYWNACRCNSMAAAGIMVFDAAVNSGPAHAAAFLQTVLRVKVDGQIGPVTVAAFANADPEAVVRQLCVQREDFYHSRPNAVYFEKGWDRRAEACRDYVLALLQQRKENPVSPIDAQAALQAVRPNIIPR